MTGKLETYVKKMQEMLSHMLVEHGDEAVEDENSMIKHENGKYCLYSKDGSKKLGEYDTEEEAQKREKQVEMFKHMAATEPERIEEHIEMFLTGELPATGVPAPTVQSTSDEETEELASKFKEPLTWGVEFGEGKPVQIMRTGSFEHPTHGKFDITNQDLQMFKQNFDANIRGQQLPINVDHEGGAVGWYQSLFIEGDALMAVPDWTQDGETKVGSGAYRYFSPEFYRAWKDPESGTVHKNVLIGGAITNYPFLKRMAPLELSEFKRLNSDPDSKTKTGEVQLTEEEIKALQEKAAKADELQAKLDEAQQSQVQLTETQRQFTELQGTVAKLTEQVKQSEHDKLVVRMTEVVRGSGDPNKRIIGNEDQKVTLAVQMAETFGEDSEILTNWIANEQSNSEALRASVAMTEVGTMRSGATANGSAQQEFDAKRDAIMANEKVDAGKAVMLLMEREPRLYARVDEEAKRFARTHSDTHNEEE